VRCGTILGAIVVVLCIMSPAVAAPPDGPGPWADYVVSFNQGTAINGGFLPGRSDPTQALGVAEQPAGDNNPFLPGTFVSLGFGGSLTLGFDNPICNQPGADLAIEVREITQEPYPDETAQVYVSEDGVNFLFAGTVTKDASVGMPAGITVANFVRLVDISSPASFAARPNADGFDVDGVRALNTSCPPGKIEICKASTNGMAYKSFQFSLNGGTPFTVKGGRCTGAITTQPGLNTVVELPSSPPTDVSAIAVRPSARLISKDLPNRTVKVKVPSGTTAANETQVTFTDEPAGGTTGDLKICKLTSTPAFVGKLFSFSVNGGPLVSTEASNASGDPSTWSCRLVGTFKTGSRVTVQEQIQSGTVVDFIDSDPALNLFDFNLLTGTAIIDITGGTNIVMFDNEAIPPDQGGFIEVCKDAARTGPTYTPDPAVTGLFTFTVSPLGGTPFDVSTYPGQCTTALSVPAGLVTVSEHKRPNFTLVDIFTSPDDLALLDSNLINGTADVEVPATTDPNQEVQVHFVNAAVRSQLKVCKALGPNSSVLSDQTFTLRANGVPFSVIASSSGTQCVDAGTYPVGSSVTVTEDPPGTFIDSSGGGTVTIQAGTANMSTVTNTARGLLRICKSAVPGIAMQPTFRYRVDGGSYMSIAAGGPCLLLRVSVGDHTIVEAPEMDYELDPNAPGGGIVVTPSGRKVSSDPPNRTVTVSVPYGTDGETRVDFTNRIKRGSVVVCKAAGSPPGTYNYTIYVEGPPNLFTVLAASATPNSCSDPTADFPILQTDGSKTIIGVVETVTPGVFHVTAIGVTGDRGACTPTNGPAVFCPYASGQNTTTATIDFYLGPGTNTVTYTNASG
jgi:hypothetical protein